MSSGRCRSVMTGASRDPFDVADGREATRMIERRVCSPDGFEMLNSICVLAVPGDNGGR